jgi:hypothetical protein
MRRPSLFAEIAWVLFAFIPLVQGCDSIVGETRSSADGGACGVTVYVYVYADGGLPLVDGTNTSRIDGGQTNSDDAAAPATEAEDGGAKVPAIDAPFEVDQGTRADPIDTYRPSLDGDLRFDARTQDTDRDVPGDDSFGALLDGIVHRFDASNDPVVLDSHEAGADQGISLDVGNGVDGSDVRDALSDQGTDVLVDAPPIVGNDAGIDAGPIDVAPDPRDVRGSAIDVEVPILAKQVSTGMYHTCALRNDGTPFCWGSNASGQSTPPTDTLFSQIDSGDSYNCGVALDRTIACWGINNEGQGTPVAGQFSQVATGALHTCAIRSNGTAICWGYNSNGQCNAPVGTFIQVTAGSLHTCGIQTGGTIVCWGSNAHSESVAPSGVYSQVSARRFHTCAIQGGGVVVCWGSNNYGESTPPVGSFTQVAAGYWHACGILSDGTVACWGSNSVGQSTPPSGIFRQLSAESDHTCGVRSDGTVICWGSNSSGQSTPP